MRRCLVSSALLSVLTTSAFGQAIKSIDVGVTGGAVRDYYGFEFGPTWEQYAGARVDATLWRRAWGEGGVGTQFDTYSYNSLERTEVTPTCGDLGAGYNCSKSKVNRLSAGPFVRRSLAEAYDVSLGIQGGWAKRFYSDSKFVRGGLEDETGHAFFSAELGAGVRYRRFRVGAQVEYGAMQRVRKPPIPACGPTVDPLPGSHIDCSPRYGSRGFSRVGLTASYRLAKR